MSAEAEREITAVLHRYCRGIDRMDTDLVRSAYHEDAIDDHGNAFRGGVEDYIDWVMPVLRERFSSTMHTLSNITVEIEGDTAYAESYLIAYHVTAGTGSLRVFGARYVDRLENRPELGWRIVHRVLMPEWQVEQAGNFVPTPVPTAPAARDRTDRSYSRRR